MNLVSFQLSKISPLLLNCPWTFSLINITTKKRKMKLHHFNFTKLCLLKGLSFKDCHTKGISFLSSQLHTCWKARDTRQNSCYFWHNFYSRIEFPFSYNILSILFKFWAMHNRSIFKWSSWFPFKLNLWHFLKLCYW